MEIQHLIDALSRPGVYPHAVDSISVCQTHLSAVFLAGPYVYKIKKPKRLGFVDFSTLSLREHYCREEVRLNRRLAADVYLGVVPVAMIGNEITVDGTGEVVEWAVKMRRLPEEATLKHRMLHGHVEKRVIQRLAERIAQFHAGAAGGPAIAAFGGFDVVAGNARENFDQLASQIGSAMSQSVFNRLTVLTEAYLSRLRPLIEHRAALSVPRDTHGDLRVDHVYLFPGRVAPDDLAIIDCIEFNERFRFADPVSDMAFLVMDLKAHGHLDLANNFADAYFRACGDDAGRELVQFYTSYRAAVRSKVGALKAAEQEVPMEERSESLKSARAHGLQALGELEDPARRPCLILIGGLPGTGKSTLARGLAEQFRAGLIRADAVRKELAAAAGMPRDSVSSYGAQIYTDDWNQRTYAECLRRAELLLFEGERVIVDANFREQNKRHAFLEAAARWAVPIVLFVCRAQPETARARIENRRGDASDADWDIYQHLAGLWQEPVDEERQVLHDINNDGEQTESLHAALSALRDASLL